MVDIARLPVWKARRVRVPTSAGAVFEDATVYAVGRTAMEASRVLRFWSIAVPPDQLRRVSDAVSNREDQRQTREGGGVAIRSKPNAANLHAASWCLDVNEDEVASARAGHRTLLQSLAHAVARSASAR